MKKYWTILAVICALLLLAACAGLAACDPETPASQPEAQILPQPDEVYEEPEYAVTPFVISNQFRSEDEAQQVLARYNYQIILLELHNQDAVSPEDLETAESRIEAFNSRMNAIADDLVEQGKAMAEDAAAVYSEFGPLTAEYEDDAAVGADFCGDIISVCLERANWSGGAHPNQYTSSCLFDLSAGQFIDPTQLAEDPEAFRTGAAELLMEKAAAHEHYADFWQDFDGVIAHWNESTVQFSENGMQVTYSPYEMGPYSIGKVAFTLTWEELEPLIGEAGLARLGREAENKNA